jgi:hypothetical protein
MEVDEKIILSLFRLSNSEQFYSSHFSWFKIISLKFQTCLGQGFDKKREGALNTDQPTWGTNYFDQSIYPI